MLSASAIHEAKILLVDDGPENLALIEQMLRSAGDTSVDTTSDSGVLEALHRATRCSLIVLDLQMPEMDGFDVMERLRPIGADAGGYLPVLASTGQPS